MKIFLAVLTVGLFAACAYSQTSTAVRPRITGIDHVSFYTTDADGVRSLYSGRLGLIGTGPVEPGGLARYMLGWQWVGYRAAPDPKAIDRMDHVAFTTDNVSELRKYLMANGVKVPGIEGRSDHSLGITVNDPEGHRIEFVERDQKAPQLKESWTDAGPSWVSKHMIHVGFLVHNRDAEDHFYRDILGFRLYWHGGMQADKTDWVAMQVPDGTDWLEYMLGWSEPPDLREMGVLNHISLGVADMNKAQVILQSHGWKPHDGEKAQMGKDGKWQLNVFDPDLSRIELMEFKPAEKPCCAEFTGPHPAE
jgi:catechol 2,3-dioxygenase-like lactoylglutathione lyase family enzyme